MKRLLSILLLLVFVSSTIVAQEKRATPSDAEAWVKKAIAYYKEAGVEKAFKEFSNPNGLFTKGDLYIMVYDLGGKCLAQGNDSTAVGKVRLDLTDPDGKFIIKERIEIAKEKGAGWQNYRWAHPLTREVEDKTVYVEKVDGYVFTCGAYIKK